MPRSCQYMSWGETNLSPLETPKNLSGWTSYLQWTVESTREELFDVHKHRTAHPLRWYALDKGCWPAGQGNRMDRLDRRGCGRYSAWYRRKFPMISQYKIFPLIPLENCEISKFKRKFADNMLDPERRPLLQVAQGSSSSYRAHYYRHSLKCATYNVSDNLWHEIENMDSNDLRPRSITCTRECPTRAAYKDD